jgi:hypothetical protein
MTTSYDTYPDTQTVAAAWASSQLGQPEREVRYGFAATGPAESITTPGEEPTARRVMVAAGLACGVAAGALLGVMLFAGTSQPTVVAPGPAPQHAVVVGSSTAAPVPKPVVSQQSTASTVVIPAPAPAPRVSPSTTVVTTPSPLPAPKGDTTVVIDIPIPSYPPLPPKPEDPDPEPPKPPVLDIPNFKLPDPESPKPEPPTFLPDLPLAPKLPKPVVIDPVFGP